MKNLFNVFCFFSVITGSDFWYSYTQRTLYIRLKTTFCIYTIERFTLILFEKNHERVKTFNLQFLRTESDDKKMMNNFFFFLQIWSKSLIKNGWCIFEKMWQKINHYTFNRGKETIKACNNKKVFPWKWKTLNII